jgi:lipopolysaccharide/colanic/teichoic acid biosynthesis glycosyltransferase
MTSLNAAPGWHGVCDMIQRANFDHDRAVRDAACGRRKSSMTSPVTLTLRRPQAHSRDAASGAPVQERDRRMLNVLVAALGLVLMLPVLVVIAALVRLTSRGPVLYTQTRVGVDRRRAGDDPSGHARRADLGGRPFTIVKFRTMQVQKSAPQAWARPGDQRVTPVGRVLRKFRLDELPQLYNVLRGDMNVVGPRPEQPQIFADLRLQVDRYAWRQQVLPGITGLAQVSQGYDQSVDDVRRKLAFDLEYVQRRSAAEDMRIMLRTVPVMLGRRGSL